jgi:hypothetical protein
MTFEVFAGWTSSQTINVPFENQAKADEKWSTGTYDGDGNEINWRSECNAVIKYWNGSSYQ